MLELTTKINSEGGNPPVKLNICRGQTPHLRVVLEGDIPREVHTHDRRVVVPKAGR